MLTFCNTFELNGPPLYQQADYLPNDSKTLQHLAISTKLLSRRSKRLNHKMTSRSRGSRRTDSTSENTIRPRYNTSNNQYPNDGYRGNEASSFMRPVNHDPVYFPQQFTTVSPSYSLPGSASSSTMRSPNGLHVQSDYYPTLTDPLYNYNSTSSSSYDPQSDPTSSSYVDSDRYSMFSGAVPDEYYNPLETDPFAPRAQQPTIELVHQETKHRPRFECTVDGCIDEETNRRKSFGRRHDLKRHMGSVHGEPWIDCAKARCPKTGENGFTRWDHYQAHWKKYHGESSPPRKK